MSWHFSLALVEEYSVANCSDGKLSALLNLIHMPEPFLPPGKTTRRSKHSQYGTTFVLLTEDRGEELLTWFREASPAKTSVSQEKGKVSQEPKADCGENLPGSFAKLDPLTSSWKIHQCLLFEGLETSLEIWPYQGIMQDGECLELMTLERHTSEIEYGLWLTPRASDIGKGERQETFLKRMGDRTQRCAQSLAAQVNNPKTWPTPRANDAEKRGNFDMNNPRNGLPAAVKLNSMGMIPTPVASDTGSRKHTYSQGGMALSDAAGGQLNPEWVELLMGWPRGWTSLEPMERSEFDAWFKGFSRQEMSSLRETVQPTQDAEWPDRGRERVLGPEELQPDVREHSNEYQARNIPLEGSAVPEGSLRGLRLQETPHGSSLRSESEKQRSEEPSNPLRSLPRFLARYGQEAWKDGRWENAVPRIGHGVPHRVDRLKALGNGQVPQVARRAFMILCKELFGEK